jgi:flagellar motor switch protein FliM
MEAALDGVRKLDLATRDHFSPGAQAAMDEVAATFARAARRSLPFLSRFKARIAPGPATTARRDQPAHDTLPTFTLGLAGPAGVWAQVTLTTNAIALILEGALGGRGGGSAAQLPHELTVAQRALVGRIARSLGTDLAAAVRAHVGIAMEITNDEPRREGKAETALRAVCDIEGLGVPAAIVLDVAAEAIDDALHEANGGDEANVDPGIGGALPEVCVEVVAELGRVSLGLRRILALRPGDVLRLPTAVDDAVSVRIEGLEKFVGVPITSRGQLAVEIRARHET